MEISSTNSSSSSSSGVSASGRISVDSFSMCGRLLLPVARRVIGARLSVVNRPRSPWVPFVALLAPLVGPLVVAGCASDDTADGPSTTMMNHTSQVVVQLPLAPYGGCGDAVFWAIGKNNEQGLMISVDASRRSTSEPTVLDITLPDPSVTVTLTRGAGLDQPMCNDVLGPEYRVDSEVPAVSGSVHIELGPRTTVPGEGVSGLATTHDLILQDGTQLIDLYISTQSIGFYAG